MANILPEGKILLPRGTPHAGGAFFATRPPAVTLLGGLLINSLGHHKHGSNEFLRVAPKAPLHAGSPPRTHPLPFVVKMTFIALKLRIEGIGESLGGEATGWGFFRRLINEGEREPP